MALLHISTPKRNFCWGIWGGKISDYMSVLCKSVYLNIQLTQLFRRPAGPPLETSAPLTEVEVLEPPLMIRWEPMIQPSCGRRLVRVRTEWASVCHRSACRRRSCLDVEPLTRCSRRRSGWWSPWSYEVPSPDVRWDAAPAASGARCPGIWTASLHIKQTQSPRLLNVDLAAIFCRYLPHSQLRILFLADVKSKLTVKYIGRRYTLRAEAPCNSNGEAQSSSIHPCSRFLNLLTDATFIEVIRY